LLTGQKPQILPGSFLIQGKVTNSLADKWDFAMTGFLSNTSHQVEIQKDGTFRKLFKTDGMQNLYLYLNNDAITIYIQPGDTIRLEWDENNFGKTFAVSSPSVWRNNELQLNLQQYNSFRQAEMNLRMMLSQNRNIPDSAKFRLIIDQYNQQLQSILSKPLYKNYNKYIYEVYFNYMSLLLSNKLIPLKQLTPDTVFVNPQNSKQIKQIIPKPADYKVLSDKWFYECPSYRDFIYNYIRFGVEPFSSNMTTYSLKTDFAPFEPGLNDYYKGLSSIRLIPIRDWFITRVIMQSFEYYTFNESEAILKDFLPKCRTRVYSDTLTSYYELVKKFKSGNPAPQFSLRNQNGKLISLKDFKGKVVFIDFWGVSCGPCRYEISNHVPKLHAKYSDKDVVFINICVDSNEETWKKTLAETKLDGINLIAEGWTNNQVCKDYNINGIPHYVLLDRQGRFVNANMARPSQIVSGQNKEIDQLLTIK
jgi:peroxiredoxin